jgi:hypothetical protein
VWFYLFALQHILPQPPVTPGQGFPGGYCARGDEAELTSRRKKTDCFAKKTGANLTQMGIFKHHLCVVFFFNGVSTILTIKNMGISLLIGDYK